MAQDSDDQTDDSSTEEEAPDDRIQRVIRRGTTGDRTGRMDERERGPGSGDGRSEWQDSGDTPEDTGSPDDGEFLSISRRRMMQSAAAAGAGTTFAGTAGGDKHFEERFELDGFTEGWVGLAPEEIEGEENPTLELEVGETYVVEWINADGVPHDFVILDAEGNEIVGTEIMSDEGESLELEFEATEEMAEYYCSVHPAEMRGDIELVDVDPVDPEEIRLVEPGPTVGLETVAENLTAPVDLDQPVGDERRFVVDQPGQIYVLEDDELQEEPFLDIEDRIPQLGIENGEGFDERGVLGLAFHPEFEDNGRFFVRYSGHRGEVTPANWSHTFVVAEFQADDDGHADPDSERRLLEIPQPQFNHNAGPLEFGPDGYLYVAVGDGGDADDTGPGHVQDWYGENEGGNGQNVTDTMLGGMLRIDVDEEAEDKPYAIPEDNPFAVVDEEAPDDKDEDEDDENENEGNDDATVAVSDHPDLGEILVDGDGFTLYMFDEDPQGEDESACHDECVEAWPPLTVEEDQEPEAGEGVGAQLTTFEREDGETQVAADGWPVYYFANDEKPGMANGQAAEDVWWVLRPDGDPIREEMPAIDDDLPEEVPDVDGIAEYWAWGMRNPWGMSFTEEGEFLVADVGQLLFEIVNHVRGGGNYGWNVKEGVHCFDTENPGQPPEECPDEVPEEIGGGEPLIDPVIEYPQEYGVQNLGSAIIGGDIYRGDDVEGLEGAYVFADWSQLFAEPLGRMYVSYPPDGWPDDPDAVPEESLQDQGEEQPFFQEERWGEIWPMEELDIVADEELLRDEQPDGEEEIDRLEQFVLAVEPDAEGNLYVLTQEVPEPFGDTGRVLRIVPPDEIDDEEDENDGNNDEEDENDGNGDHEDG